MNNLVENGVDKTWKIGLPMYLNTQKTKEYYNFFLQKLILELKQLGVSNNIKIVTEFPEDLYTWWLDPDVLFTQSCGYPYITNLDEYVQLIGTPCFGVEGSRDATYSSFFITHIDLPWQSLAEAKHSRVVINQADSNSGMNVLRAEILELIEDEKNFFDSVQYSDSHMNSLKMIQNKKADMAAIDCVTFAYIQKYAPEHCQNIKIIGKSQQTFALPFIASSFVSKQLKQNLFIALRDILKHNSELCRVLMIKDIIQTERKDYLPILDLKNKAFARKYFELSLL